MLLDKQLFLKIAKEAALSPKLRMNYDLRDSEDENSQRMLNVMCKGSMTPIHRHTDTTEDVVCIYGSVIEHYYDENGNEMSSTSLVAGSDTVGICVEKGIFHALEAISDIAVVFSVKAGRFIPMKLNESLHSDKSKSNK